MLSKKAFKSLAILDFILDILLIISIWVLMSDIHKLKKENTLLKNEVVEQENQITEKDNYIDYLEMVVVEAKIFE